MIHYLQVSPFVRITCDVLESDWAKGAAFDFLILPTPFILLLDRLNNCVRGMRGRVAPEDKGNKQTPAMNRIIKMVQRWNVVAVANCAMLLAIFYVVVSVLATKVAYVGLSWLNAKLGKSCAPHDAASYVVPTRRGVLSFCSCC